MATTLRVCDEHYAAGPKPSVLACPGEVSARFFWDAKETNLAHVQEWYDQYRARRPLTWMPRQLLLSKVGDISRVRKHDCVLQLLLILVGYRIPMRAEQ